VNNTNVKFSIDGVTRTDWQVIPEEVFNLVFIKNKTKTPLQIVTCNVPGDFRFYFFSSISNNYQAGYWDDEKNSIEYINIINRNKTLDIKIDLG